MTSRTKRRLAVLALALGLIAAAPYVFHAIADQHVSVYFGNRAPWVAGLKGRMMDNQNVREAFFWAGYAVVGFKTSNGESRIVCVRSVLAPDRIINVPHESITLRVACAVALAGTWLLVIACQALVRKLTRTNPASVAE